MTALRVLVLRVLALFRRRNRYTALDEEIRTHLDLLAADHVRRGLSPEDARTAARRDFGGVEQVKEAYRDRCGLPLLESVARDVRYAVRMLRRNPGFTLVAVLSLAMGIGANSAIFALVNALLIRDLPVEDPDSLAVVSVRGPRGGGFVSYPMFRDLAARQQAFSDLAASGGLRPNRVRMEGHSQNLDGVDAAFVSSNYFSMLGVEAVVGRVFTSDDSLGPGEGEVAVIGFGFWERLFGRDPGAVGRTIIVNSTPLTIIGVSARGFFGDRVGTVRDVWVPILMQPRIERRNMIERRTASWFRTIGRLKPGVSDSQAAAELTALFQQLKANEIAGGTGSLIHRDQSSAFRVEIERGSRALNMVPARVQQSLKLLMAVVGLVLLIACCNVANLLLARGTARRREIGVRLALGCSRRRLVAQLLTESMLMSLAGAGLGLVLAQWTSQFLAARFIGALDAGPDARVVAFTLAASLLVTVMFGLFPALRATSLDLAPSLQAASRQSGSRPRQRMSRLLVASQVGLSLWLLIGAGLLLRSLQNLKDLEIGVDRRLVLMLNAFLVDSDSIAKSQMADLRARLAEGLRRIPGVTSVSFSESALFSGSATTAPVRVPGSPVNPETDGEVRQNPVSPNYFETVGMRLKAGRGFIDQDTGPEPRVAVINETMARHYFGRENPIGRAIYFPKVDADGRYIPFGPNLGRSHGVKVVGVVEDAKYDNLRQSIPRMAFLPMPRDQGGLGSIDLRVTRDPSTVAPHIHQVLGAIDPNIALRSIRTLEEQIDRTLTEERMFTGLLGVFGGLALVLACVGLYGMMAYAVAGRTGEIGIRMALGAMRSDVVSMILRETFLLAAVGVALGIPAALATTHLLRSLLFGLTPTDPATIGAMALLMLGVAALAGFVPARRAAGVDPIEALRHE